MSKKINFGFYTIRAVHNQQNRQEKDLALFFKDIEKSL